MIESEVFVTFASALFKVAATFYMVIYLDQDLNSFLIKMLIFEGRAAFFQRLRRLFDLIGDFSTKVRNNFLISDSFFDLSETSFSWRGF